MKESQCTDYRGNDIKYKAHHSQQYIYHFVPIIPIIFLRNSYIIISLLKVKLTGAPNPIVQQSVCVCLSNIHMLKLNQLKFNLS